MDLFGINMAPTNFGQKKRGRLDPSTKFFGIGEGKMMTMEEFVPKVITRKMVTSRIAHMFLQDGMIQIH